MATARSVVVTVGLDLGGTNLYAVVLDDEDRSIGHAKLRTPTSGDRDGVIDVMVRAFDAAVDDAGIERDAVRAVGAGSPGVVISGTVGNASNVPGFDTRFSLADALRARLDRPVRVSNDVTAAAVAEHRLGGGRGASSLMAVFWGTGVGAGLVLDGRPYEGLNGGAGELGHVVARPGGTTCPCGRQGCIEAYAGRRAMTLTAERAIADGAESVLFDVMEERGRPRATSGVFATALERGDRLTRELIDDAVAVLGLGLAGAVNLLDIEVVVLGGGLADKLGEPARRAVDAAMRPALFLQPPTVQLVPAMLGDEAGAVGAALLAREAA